LSDLAAGISARVSCETVADVVGHDGGTGIDISADLIVVQAAEPAEVGFVCCGRCDQNCYAPMPRSTREGRQPAFRSTTSTTIQMFRWIECVGAELLARCNVVAAVDVLVDMGLLRPSISTIGGAVACPTSSVIDCNLTHLSGSCVSCVLTEAVTLSAPRPAQTASSQNPEFFEEPH